MEIQRSPKMGLSMGAACIWCELYRTLSIRVDGLRETGYWEKKLVICPKKVHLGENMI